jgi:hypothetical protein
MVALLLAFLGCSPAPGHDTDAYDACARFWLDRCTCTTNADVAQLCDQWGDKLPDAECAAFDGDVCDPSSDSFDADKCEAYHDTDVASALDYYNCANEKEAQECDSSMHADECGAFPSTD